ncbi:MAG TPA: universal stress protein [Burkholderiales bacterium]|nr:universal stress protein [Burkholderiales bacterium]
MVYKRILVPVDGSPTSMAGLNEALRLARNQKARVRLVHIVDEVAIFASSEGGLNIEPVIEALKSGGKRILARAAKLAAARGVRAETELFENATNRVADVLIGRARRWRADLIVMGTHGRRGVNRLVLGSDAELVVRNSPVPVLLVRSARRG